jgi:hypothetical protein
VRRNAISPRGKGLSVNLDIIGIIAYDIPMSVALKQGIWTPEKRLEQSAALRARKIWLKSTGPRTPEGKAKSSLNACKPGHEQRRDERLQTIRLRKYLRLNRLFRETYVSATRTWNALSRVDRSRTIQNFYNLKNELSYLDAEIHAYLDKPSNIVDFPARPPD